MPLEVRPFTGNEAREAALVTTKSFHENPFRKILFPDGFGQRTVEKTFKGYLEAVEDPDTFAVQIWDTDEHRMAAFAIWSFTKPMTDEKWNQKLADRLEAYREARPDAVQAFLKLENEHKRKVMGMSRWWELDNLHVAPDYQRKGLGSQLMKLGEEEFNKRQVPSIIVSTEAGYGLYLKYGYQVQERYVVDMAKYGGEGTYFNAVLTKSPNSAYSENKST